uniref:Uncharacterized protein n=1 Tax=Micrurus carvalhoi TaxID=3147026 RepID=A0A2H6MZM4_9SAUR
MKNRTVCFRNVQFPYPKGIDSLCLFRSTILFRSTKYPEYHTLKCYNSGHVKPPLQCQPIPEEKKILLEKTEYFSGKKTPFLFCLEQNTSSLVLVHLSTSSISCLEK